MEKAYMFTDGKDYRLSKVKTDTHPFELSIQHTHKFSPVAVSETELDSLSTYFYNLVEDKKAYLVACRPKPDVLLTSFGLGESVLLCNVTEPHNADFSITCPNNAFVQYYGLSKTNASRTSPGIPVNKEEIELFIASTLSGMITDGFVVRTFGVSQLRHKGKVFVLPESKASDKIKRSRYIFS